MKTEISQYARDELTAWTLLATDGLAKDVRDRITQEVESHFSDAVKDHFAGGMPADAAEAMALSDLGDINTAARGFRKRYLTLEDELWLRGKTGQRQQIALRRYFWFQGLCILVQAAFLTYAFVNWYQNRTHRGTQFVFLTILWICFAAFTFTELRLSFLAKRPAIGKAFWRSWLACELAQTSFLYSFLAATFGLQMSLLSSIPASMICLFGVVILAPGMGLVVFRKSFQIWRKLGNYQPKRATD